jgi:hypothetical protein
MKVFGNSFYRILVTPKIYFLSNSFLRIIKSEMLYAHPVENNGMLVGPKRPVELSPGNYF